MGSPSSTPLGPTYLMFCFFVISDEYKDALVQLSNWIEEGKLRYKETIVNGIENVGEAFVSVMKGGNIGKQIVKVSDI